MANTYFVTLNTDLWTDVSQGNPCGYITNRSDHVIFYIQSESVPSPSILQGHRLQPGSSLNFTVVLPEIVFMRSVQSDGQVIVTP